jgi:hypothetical protein
LELRFIPAPISIAFSAVKDDFKLFKREFDSFGESDDDPIGQWLKLAKARGETKESDQVVLNLLIELHRKIDLVIAKLENEEKKLIMLDFNTQIAGINYDYFKIQDIDFEAGKEYYGRISMPTFPKRDVAVFFVAEDKKIAKITLLHDRDIKEWNSYVASRERAMIREMKGR